MRNISVESKEKNRARMRQWYSSLTKDKKLELNKRNREFYENATEEQLKKRRDRNKRWYDLHPEVIHSKNRRPNHRFSFSKNHARVSGREWNIDIDHFKELISKTCHYCNGSLPEVGCGLDRMDNSRGYVVGNVVPCCINCNIIKRDILTYEEMVVAMDAVKNHRLSKAIGGVNG